MCIQRQPNFDKCTTTTNRAVNKCEFVGLKVLQKYNPIDFGFSEPSDIVEYMLNFPQN